MNLPPSMSIYTYNAFYTSNIYSPSRLLRGSFSPGYGPQGCHINREAGMVTDAVLSPADLRDAPDFFWAGLPLVETQFRAPVIPVFAQCRRYELYRPYGPFKAFLGPQIGESRRRRGTIQSLTWPAFEQLERATREW